MIFLCLNHPLSKGVHKSACVPRMWTHVARMQHACGGMHFQPGFLLWWTDIFWHAYNTHVDACVHMRPHACHVCSTHVPQLAPKCQWRHWLLRRHAGHRWFWSLITPLDKRRPLPLGELAALAETTNQNSLFISEAKKYECISLYKLGLRPVLSKQQIAIKSKAKHIAGFSLVELFGMKNWVWSKPALASN